jgi:hypothetical protein
MPEDIGSARGQPADSCIPINKGFHSSGGDRAFFVDAATGSGEDSFACEMWKQARAWDWGSSCCRLATFPREGHTFHDQDTISG